MPVPEPAPPARLEKFVAVRRSDQVPSTLWWSLPLALPRLGALCADALQGARLVVQPASALGTHAAAVGAQAPPGGTSVVRDVGRFFALRADGAIGPCTAALFPPR